MNKDEQVSKKIGYLFIALFIMFMVLGYFLIGKPMINSLKDLGNFKENIMHHKHGGELLFIFMIAIQVIVAVIPGEPLELASGYLFGAFWGTFYSSIGILFGSVAVFSFVKKYGKRVVNSVFPKIDAKMLKYFENERKFISVSFILMLIPGTPKDLLTYVAGLSPMDIKTWVVVSTLARIPSIVTSAVMGAAVQNRDYSTAIITFILTSILSVCGLLYYRKLENSISGGNK